MWLFPPILYIFPLHDVKRKFKGNVPKRSLIWLFIHLRNKLALRNYVDICYEMNVLVIGDMVC